MPERTAVYHVDATRIGHGRNFIGIPRLFKA